MLSNETIENLIMIKKVSVTHAKKKLDKLIKRSDLLHVTWQGDVWGLCMKALFSGIRFYCFEEGTDGYGQCMESCIVKNADIRKFYILYNKIKKTGAKEAVRQAEYQRKYVIEAIQNFADKNWDCVGCLCVAKDGIPNRIYMRWHVFNESYLSVLKHFIEFAKRLKEGCTTLEQILKSNIKGDGI
ncbi:MAG: hypothetical protein AB7G87_03805 [Clostridia bacterium]